MEYSSTELNLFYTVSHFEHRISGSHCVLKAGHWETPRKNGKASTSCESAGVIWVSTYVGCNTNMLEHYQHKPVLWDVISAYWCPHSITWLYQTGCPENCRKMVTIWNSLIWFMYHLPDVVADLFSLVTILHANFCASQPRALQQQRRQESKDCTSWLWVGGLAVVPSHF